MNFTYCTLYFMFIYIYLLMNNSGIFNRRDADVFDLLYRRSIPAAFIHHPFKYLAWTGRTIVGRSSYVPNPY